MRLWPDGPQPAAPHAASHAASHAAAHGAPPPPPPHAAAFERAASAAPLLELRCSSFSLDRLTLRQQRTMGSSRASLYQLWINDRVVCRLSAAVQCDSLNGRLGVLEPLVEPWRFVGEVPAAEAPRMPR